MKVTTLPTKSHEIRYCTDVSVFSDRNVVAKARQQIDQEIINLNDSVRGLMTRRNALAPISRLPPEILSKIFTSSAFLCSTDTNGTALSWIKVSHICRYWRAVALECPGLWSCIVFSRPKWVDEMLKRSKMAPLTIRADLTYMTPRMVEAVQSALQHISRIRELDIIASKPTMDKLLTDIASNAPLLHSLCLSNPRYSHYMTEDRFNLPDSIFGNKTPRLARLELTRCNVRWDSPLLNSLTHLKIHDTGTLSRPTMSELTSALENMPNIEILDLENSLPLIPNEASTIPSPKRVISLPNLSHISISSLVLETANLLNHVSYPAATSLKLHCRATDTTDVDFSPLFPALSHLYSSGTTDLKPLRSLMIQHRSPNTVRVQGWTSTGRSTAAPSPIASSSRVELDLTWRQYGHQKTEKVVTSVCKALPLAQLSALYMYHLENLQEAAWLNSFGWLSKLRSLHVQGPSTYWLIRALATEVEGKQQAGRGVNRLSTPRSSSLRREKTIVSPASIPFPALHTLAIEDTDFNPNDHGPYVEDLRDCLIVRCERGANIPELHLIECSHLFEDDVALLDEIVSDVHWDGLEQGFSEEEDVDEYEAFSGGIYGNTLYDPDFDTEEDYFMYGF